MTSPRKPNRKNRKAAHEAAFFISTHPLTQLAMNSNRHMEQGDLAEVQLSYRSKQNPTSQPQILDPQGAEQYLRGIWDQDAMELNEDFIVLMLTSSKHCLGWARISRGGSTATIVDPASVFKLALLANSQCLICAHNHPSNNLRISSTDKALTKRLVDAGRLLGIEVIDHLVLTRYGFSSFSQQGLM